MIRCGIARAVITPPLDTPNGIWMAQKHIRPEGLHQDLFVSALVLEDGGSGERVVMLDFDLIMLSDAQAAAVRAEVSTATGVAPESILPCCTHNHAGPVTLDTYADEGRERVLQYIASLPAFAAGAAAQAMRHMCEVRVAGGVGESDIGINRDLALASGRIVTGPNPEGFRDREVRVVRIDAEDGRPFVCIANYQCHPTVLGPTNKLISPDYPGTVKRVVEQATGAICFFLQGAAGNIGPIEGFVGDARVAERLGTMLGLEAAKVFTAIDTRPGHSELADVVESGAPLTQYRWVDEPPIFDGLRLRSRAVSLPVRHPLSEVFTGAARRADALRARISELEEVGAPQAEIVLLRQFLVREMHRHASAEAYRDVRALEVEMHALRIGPIAISLMWGEPYAQIGAEVKHRSPMRDTLFGGYTGGAPTYIPTPDVYLAHPPFEVDISPLAPEAAQIAVEAALGLLEEVVR